ncbi:PTS sugar transporter subunit IIA [Roseococcus sp. SYP-B2431]|uniref:PTS sugar transporter subunit IIA n=1 Tax=Roseococcus sp. SYP-B2431 TaxID=2496640 RepID=UPI00103CADDF|nr:PTS sugar transporter subunit IIA [Roseococcus sp. SYP-B2431]TCI00036.1 PTS sugar transporter subunit IIA [Roseococcus sp. SYP-B2431]
MAITDMFSAADGVLTFAPSSKKEMLEMLAAEVSARIGQPKAKVLEAILAREKLGSTALGRGVALPHARVDWLEAPVALLARLARPIEMEARDGEPVDLVFLVLWPESASEGFLPALSDICRALRDNQLPRQLRQARSDAEALQALLAADRPQL